MLKLPHFSFSPRNVRTATEPVKWTQFYPSRIHMFVEIILKCKIGVFFDARDHRLKVYSAVAAWQGGQGGQLPPQRPKFSQNGGRQNPQHPKKFRKYLQKTCISFKWAPLVEKFPLKNTQKVPLFNKFFTGAPIMPDVICWSRALLHFSSKSAFFREFLPKLPLVGVFLSRAPIFRQFLSREPLDGGLRAPIFRQDNFCQRSPLSEISY